jgi:hypothetical protein
MFLLFGLAEGVVCCLEIRILSSILLKIISSRKMLTQGWNVGKVKDNCRNCSLMDERQLVPYLTVSRHLLEVSYEARSQVKCYISLLGLPDLPGPT